MRKFLFSLVSLSFFAFLYLGVFSSNVEAGHIPPPVVCGTVCSAVGTLPTCPTGAGVACDCPGASADCHGTKFDDIIYGSDTGETIFAGKGNDQVCAFDGNDVVRAGFGDDRVNGGNGDDTIYGGWGEDNLWGGNDDDTIHGGLW